MGLSMPFSERAPENNNRTASINRTLWKLHFKSKVQISMLKMSMEWLILID